MNKCIGYFVILIPGNKPKKPKKDDQMMHGDEEAEEKEPSQHLYDRFKIKNLQPVYFINEAHGSKSKIDKSSNSHSQISKPKLEAEDYDLKTLDDENLMDNHKHHYFLKYYSKKPKKPKFGSFLRSAMYEDHFDFKNFGQMLVYLTKLFIYFEDDFFDKGFLVAVHPKLANIISFETAQKNKIIKNQKHSTMRKTK